VLDASVLLKWAFQDEEDSDRALSLRERHLDGEIIVIVPSHAVYEFTHVLRHSQRNLSRERIEREIDDIFNVNLVTIELDPYLAKLGVAISFQTGIAVYDANYVALAEALGCQLVTADYEALDKLKHLNFVVALRDT